MSAVRKLKGFDAGPLAAALAATGMLACTGILCSALTRDPLAAGGSGISDLNVVAVEAATLPYCTDAVCLADNRQTRR
jgi:hypothetical protein